MSDAAPECAPNPAIAGAQWRMRLLEELAEIGMTLVRELRDTAGKAEPTPSKGRDPADAFARLSRAVRMTLALHAKTEKALGDLKTPAPPAKEAEPPVSRELIARSFQEMKAMSLVAAAAEVEIEDEEALGDVLEALLERVEEDEAYDNIPDRPMRETVERLCRDLELTPDWSRWENDEERWDLKYPLPRPRSSPFNAPSRRPLLGPDGVPRNPAAPARPPVPALE